jgi:hypothetical protein
MKIELALASALLLFASAALLAPSLRGLLRFLRTMRSGR